MLPELVLYNIMQYLRRVDQQALRCVNMCTSKLALLSIKRDRFCRCAYCYKRMRKQKPRKFVYVRSIRLEYLINLECGCRVHRKCYIGTTDTHRCYYLQFNTVVPGIYYPKPVLQRLKDPKFRDQYDKIIELLRQNMSS